MNDLSKPSINYSSNSGNTYKGKKLFFQSQELDNWDTSSENDASQSSSAKDAAKNAAKVVKKVLKDENVKEELKEAASGALEGRVSKNY